MAFNTNLSISDLADVLAAIKEVTKPYQLGIQLKIDLAELDSIEKNHRGDVDRQKTEVVKYWLRNSPDASWTTLANAVERMRGHARLARRLREEIKGEKEKQNTSAIEMERLGGHARLVGTLRGKEQSIMEDTTKLQREEEQIHEDPVGFTQILRSRQTSYVRPMSKLSRSETLPLDKCAPCNILLLGKMGHGTSTLGNRILGHDGSFKINDQQCPQIAQGSSVIRSASQLKNYIINVYDHTGLFEGASSIDELSSAVPEKLNLVIFVLKRGCDFDKAILKSVMSGGQISKISALVLTHCESLSEEERRKTIKRFKKDHPSIAQLMGKGILTVGFPDSSHIQPELLLSQRVEEDKANLRKLIYSCDEPVLIPELIQNHHLQI
jgi:hypothetical protein